MSNLWRLRRAALQVVCSYVMMVCPIAATMIGYSWIKYQLRHRPGMAGSGIFCGFANLNQWHVPGVLLWLFGLGAVCTCFLIARKSEVAEDVAAAFIWLAGAVTVCYVSYAALALYSMAFYIDSWVM